MFMIIMVARYKSIKMTPKIMFEIKNKRQAKSKKQDDMLSPAEWWANEFDMRGEKKITKIVE